ncbi:MAG: hypothetical protein FXF47_06525 [Candidatus Mcinerneyibacterium aminivorans]|uniref:Nucleotidyltransferase n=1 Tax=Candidatus Mcinerneyibacterium aminivorans TaxID=2703815 RepID=A0A5D0MI92_9BACT|nr:MAG: hypothetical protein FXF47_06525 [Candidatus Mcinerneyibacterium aminivorans]
MKNTYNLEYSKLPLNNPKKILKILNNIFEKFETDFMIIGAIARIVLLENIYGYTRGRATKDLDLSVFISNWKEYDNIMNEFVNEYSFRKNKKIYHRISNNEYAIDIIPSGKIAKNGEIFWPPNYENSIDVDFFIKSFENSLLIKPEYKSDNLNFHIPNLEGLFVLKFIGWYERKYSSDAGDLDLILSCMYKNYENILFEKYSELITYDYKYHEVFPKILSKELFTILNSEKYIRKFNNYLDLDVIENQLVPSMVKTNRNLDPDTYESYIEIFRILKNEFKNYYNN